MCDGKGSEGNACEGLYHALCVGLSAIPEGAWFCSLKCKKGETKKKAKKSAVCLDTMATLVRIVCLCVCVCVCVCVHVCVCVSVTVLFCLCVWICTCMQVQLSISVGSGS
jgi:hypothetical protein